MEIHEKYNELRERVEGLREAIALNFGDDKNHRTEYSAKLAERIRAIATEMAEAEWPDTMARLAEIGERLPEGPVQFVDTGFTWVRIGGSSICASRSKADVESFDVLLRNALDAARAELREELKKAEAAFERYRLAVAQGVAVAPTE